MSKRWKPWPGGQCPDCGSNVEYLDDGIDYSSTPSDHRWPVTRPIRCVKCGKKGDHTGSGCGGQDWERKHEQHK